MLNVGFGHLNCDFNNNWFPWIGVVDYLSLIAKGLKLEEILLPNV